MNDTTTDIASGSPLAIDHVVGQERAVRQLKTALEAFYNDRAAGVTDNAFPHVLLVGPPGCGKSMLASILARELGGQMHEELAQNIASPGVLHGLLMLAEEGDCIFLDEIHELVPAAQTTLYRCLEERRLFLPGTKATQRQSLTLPPFTFIGATTDEWSLTKPLRDRFRLVLRLEHYEVEALAQLLTQRARRLGWDVDPLAVEGMAGRARGTPRLGLRLLEAARRVARAEAGDRITLGHFVRMCEIEEIDPLGLDSLEQRYLRILHETQGTVRLNVLATRLGLPRQTIERVIEPDLIRLGLVAKDDSGRLLTPFGRQHTVACGSS